MLWPPCRLLVHPSRTAVHAKPETPQQQPAPLPKVLRSLPPPQRVAAFADLSALAAAARAALLDATPDPQATPEAARKRLAALLPHLPPTDSREFAALQQAAAADLAADLSSSAGRVRSRLTRALTLVNIAWFIGCLLVVSAATSLFGLYAAALLALIPLPAYEAAGYAASFAILQRATAARPSTAPYIALTGERSGWCGVQHSATWPGLVCDACHPSPPLRVCSSSH